MPKPFEYFPAIVFSTLGIAEAEDNIEAGFASLCIGKKIPGQFRESSAPDDPGYGLGIHFRNICALRWVSSPQ